MQTRGPRQGAVPIKSDIPGTIKNREGTYKVDQGYAIGQALQNVVKNPFLNKVDKQGNTPYAGGRGVSKPNPKYDSNTATRFPSYKKGGTVKKTGLALVHKGEKVTPVEKALKKHKEISDSQYQKMVNKKEKIWGQGKF